MVVRVADRVLIAVGQLPLDPVPVVASGVEAGAQQMSEPVASLAPFVTHCGKRLVHSVLAHGSGPVIAPREGEGIGAGQFMQGTQQDHGLAW